MSVPELLRWCVCLTLSAGVTGGQDTVKSQSAEGAAAKLSQSVAACLASAGAVTRAICQDAASLLKPLRKNSVRSASYSRRHPFLRAPCCSAGDEKRLACLLLMPAPLMEAPSLHRFPFGPCLQHGRLHTEHINEPCEQDCLNVFCGAQSPS